MLTIIFLITWTVSIFTNIYLYKLIFGKSACILDGSNPFKSIVFILFSPIISILLFIKLVISNSCEFSAYILAKKPRACVSCVSFVQGKCRIYDIPARKRMLCKGELYNQKNT